MVTVNLELPAGKIAPVTLIRFCHNGVEKRVRGRDAWALSELFAAGAVGVTPITHPGPRWAAYCWKLRKLGLNVETITEMHGGTYAGKHARYVLHSRISVLEAA